jgi:hypothetical protein
MRYRLVGTCVGACGRHVAAFDDGSREITYRTFVKYADKEDLKAWMEANKYGRKYGLCLSDDWAVSYYKGVYRGNPCVVMKWSSIHHFFVGPGRKPC